MQDQRNIIRFRSGRDWAALETLAGLDELVPEAGQRDTLKPNVLGPQHINRRGEQLLCWMVVRGYDVRHFHLLDKMGNPSRRVSVRQRERLVAGAHEPHSRDEITECICRRIVSIAPEVSKPLTSDS